MKRKTRLFSLVILSVSALTLQTVVAQELFTITPDFFQEECNGDKHDHDRVITTNDPHSPTMGGIETSQHRAATAAERAAGVHASSGDSMFRYPAVFFDYGYSEMKDDRTGGFDTLTHSLTLGMDFMTVGDLFVGGMVSWSESNGDSEGNNDQNGQAWTFTLYGSKAINENVFAGTSLSYSHDDSTVETPGGANSDTTTETYAIAPYVSFVKRFDQFSISLTPTYSLSFAVTDPAEAIDRDRSLRGEFLLICRGTYMATETLDLFAAATLHQIIHSHLMDAEQGQDHTWLGTKAGAIWRVTENVSLEASAAYDAFHKNYRSNINANASVTLSF